MSNFLNSLLYGFTNILSVGPEEPKEGETNGCGSGCCKDQPKEQEGCQTDTCCTEPKESASCKTETVNDSCCKTDIKKEQVNDGCCKSDTDKQACACEGEKEPVVIDNLKIIFSTLTGTAKIMATEIENKIQQNTRVTVNKIEMMDITEYDNDNLLQETAVCVFILSTYNVEGPLDW